MATDGLYKVDSNIKGSWSMDKAIVQFNTEQGSLEEQQLIATGFQMRYARQITPFRPINIEGTYLVGGRPQGSLVIQALIGPSSTVKAFLDQYGDLCKATGATNNVTIRPGGIEECKAGNTESKQTTSFELSGCAINDVSLSVQQIGELSVVTSAISMIFTGCAVKAGT